ncbi:MAG: disulfide bond formation protein B [Salinarimonas sp.]
MSRLASLLEAHRLIAFLIAALAMATIGAALFFEHVVGLYPCVLCLYQRWPYYAAIPLALVVGLFAANRGAARAGLTFLGLVFLGGTALALYHVGVEIGVFLGPSDCGGAPMQAAADMDAFMAQLESARVIDCSQPAWVFLGLSMAGWNALISFALALLALASAATSGGKIALTH